MIIYHGGTDIVKAPRVIAGGLARDFGAGFYTTDICEQAITWAKRQGRIRRKNAVLNVYEFDYDKAINELNCKMFTNYAVDWLKFIVNNRSAPNSFKHDYDIVYGKIANDDVGETVQAVVDGLMPMDFALERLTFMKTNSQYAFCTEKSLAYIHFTEYQEVK